MKKTGAMMRAFIILGLFLMVALVASPAMGAADSLPAIKTMKVQLWPEYDDPRVMVTYQGEFKDASLFPQAVKFPAPLGSEMSMVCALKPPDDEHLCQLYDTLTAPDSLAVSYTLPIPTYYLEYYWDGIKAQPDKSFAFKYISPYAIDSLEIEVQQPLRANDFKLIQPYASITSDSLGMKYYHYVFTNVTPGQTISIDASYTKPDNKPSVSKKTGSGTGSIATGGSSSNTLIATGAALLLAVTVGFLLLRRKPAVAPARISASRRTGRIESRRGEIQRAESPAAHRQPTPKLPGQSPTRSAPAAKPEPASTRAVFCSKCGTKLAGEASFCHACGVKVIGAD